MSQKWIRVYCRAQYQYQAEGIYIYSKGSVQQLHRPPPLRVMILFRPVLGIYAIGKSDKTRGGTQRYGDEEEASHLKCVWCWNERKGNESVADLPTFLHSYLIGAREDTHFISSFRWLRTLVPRSQQSLSILPFMITLTASLGSFQLAPMYRDLGDTKNQAKIVCWFWC